MQFAHVARPIVCGKRVVNFRRKHEVWLPFLFENTGKQQGQILLALAERRQRKRQNIDSIKEIVADFFLAPQLVKIAIRGGDDARFGFARRSADRRIFAFLQDAQQFHLLFRRQFADFIEKKRPASRAVEKAVPVTIRPGKRPFLIAEHQAFEQRFRDCAAIHRHERKFSALAHAMNFPRNQFFARAGFARNQNRILAGGGMQRMFIHRLHHRAFPNHLAEFKAVAERKAHEAVFLL